MQLAYQEGIIFHEQKWNKKFFKLSPQVENEERLQRGSSFRECQPQRVAEGPAVPQQLVPHGLQRKLDLAPHCDIMGAK